MNRPTLTVCISSMHSRTLQLAHCLVSLRPPKALAHRVEILISIDGATISLGQKRNSLNQRAQGDYVCHVDDDDLVAPGYYYKILTAIDEYPTVDAVLVRGERTEHGKSRVEFDYRLGGKEGEWLTVGGTSTPIIWRSPGHICPIRTELAREVMYPDVTGGEDLAWSAKLAPLLESAARAGKPGEILYFYQWVANKEPGT